MLSICSHKSIQVNPEHCFGRKVIAKWPVWRRRWRWMRKRRKRRRRQKEVEEEEEIVQGKKNSNQFRWLWEFPVILWRPFKTFSMQTMSREISEYIISSELWMTNGPDFPSSQCGQFGLPLHRFQDRQWDSSLEPALSITSSKWIYFFYQYHRIRDAWGDSDLQEHSW